MFIHNIGALQDDTKLAEKVTTFDRIKFSPAIPAMTSFPLASNRPKKNATQSSQSPSPIPLLPGENPKGSPNGPIF
ncbi:MAG TPA: hypothetical protein DDW68_01675 [Verrucomicrobiales bacterium]|nr:hypothetical protein [Verrucomicrobiales bacterium]